MRGSHGVSHQLGKRVMNLIGRTLTTLSLVLCTCPAPAHAEESNRAKSLADECKLDAHSCEEYLLGVWDSVLVYGEMAHASLFCTSAAPTGRQLHAAFDKWVQDNPDKMGLSRAVGAILALKHAYACGTTRS